MPRLPVRSLTEAGTRASTGSIAPPHTAHTRCSKQNRRVSFFEMIDGPSICCCCTEAAVSLVLNHRHLGHPGRYCHTGAVSALYCPVPSGCCPLSVTFSAFWLRSSVVSVLISLIFSAPLGAEPARGLWTSLGRLPLRVSSIGKYAFQKKTFVCPHSGLLSGRLRPRARLNLKCHAS